MTGVAVAREDRCAVLTIERPPLNVLDLEALDALRTALERLADDADVQLLIVRGAGDRAFSAGVAVEDHTPDRIESMLDTFHGALRILLDFPAPTVAAIRGHCLGGGMELAACCDLRFAAADATFGQPEIALGCYPPWAAAHYPTLLGLAATVDLLLTGRTVDAAEAARLGFVDRLAATEALDGEVEAFSTAVLDRSAAVGRLAIAAIRARRRHDFTAALEESERLYTEDLTRTADMGEGLSAFLDKRTPRWRHR